MGVTGLETAFAALHTDLVLPGVIDLGLLVERMAGGAEPFGLERRRLAPGSEANVALCDLEAEWTVGEDGYESRSVKLLVRRPRADRPGADDARRRPGRLPAAHLLALGVAAVSHLLLEDGARFVVVTSSTSPPPSRSRSVRAAKAAGVQISAEASPHHLCLTDEEVRSLDPHRFKMNPPLRAERDRQALIEGLRDGTIECIATDHAPHAAGGKGGPLRAGGDGRDRPRDRLRRAPHRAGPARA